VTEPAVYVTPTSEDLELLLGLSGIDEDRAELIIRLAEGRAKAVVAPLPAGAESTVLAVAARVFVNPQAASGNVVTGPYSAPLPSGGLYLTRDDRRALRLLAGGGAAFTVNPTPDDAGAPPGDPARGWWVEAQPL
jgi:hypothetical protein